MQQATFEFTTTTVRRRRSTQERAHDKVKPSVKQIQRMLLKAFYEGERISADTWAVAREISPYIVRPRMTYFKKGELIYRVGYGLTVEGNDQEQFELLPYIRNYITTLAAQFGLDKAIDQILEGLEK